MTSTKEQALAALKILADTNRRQFGSEHPAFAVIRQYIESTSAEAVHRAQPKSTNDMILVSKMKLLHALQHAQMAGDLIVQFSKDEKTKAGMCGYLDDACSSADIAAKDLKEMVNCTPSAPRPGAARRAQLESTEEGRKLITDLIAFATQPQFVRSVTWRQPGDLVIWDNRCTMHRATPFEDTRYRRDMRRTTVLENLA